ncbi:MAG: hypothetical protein KGO49_12200 [Gammaproteobacteria bacterium]|nr:hypothetical protein [Gammaproteobacteria bacterium]
MNITKAKELHLPNYDTNAKLAFIKAIFQSLSDTKEGNMMDLDEAKRRLGIV